MTLAYDVSRLLRPGARADDLREFVPEPGGRHYRQGRVETSPIAGSLFLRGTVVAGAIAEFGLEKFFVPEGQGHDYEAAVRAPPLGRGCRCPGRAGGLRRLVVE